MVRQRDGPVLASSDEITNKPVFKRWPEREDGPMDVGGNTQNRGKSMERH